MADLVSPTIFSTTWSQIVLTVHVMLLAIVALSIMAFGFLVMARGRNAFSWLQPITIGSGMSSVLLLAVGGGRMLVGALASAVLAVLAHRLERRLIERRARRIGKGGAARRH